MEKVTAFFVSSFLFITYAAFPTILEFNDGGAYDIDYAVSAIRVDQGLPGVGTTVNVVTSGYCHQFYGYGDSVLGMSDGFVHFIATHDNSRLYLSGGIVMEHVDALDNSRMFISDFLGVYLTALDSSYIEISGGSMGSVRALENSHIRITGGGFYEANTVFEFGDRYQHDSSVITFVGSNFARDGFALAYGEYTTADFTDGNLTGILASGQILSNQIYLEDDSKIILAPVPEPAGLLVMALGALLLKNHKKCL